MLLETKVQTVANCVVRKKIGKKLDGEVTPMWHYCSAAGNNTSGFSSSGAMTPPFILLLRRHFGRATLKEQSFLNSLLHGTEGNIIQMKGNIFLSRARRPRTLMVEL